MCQHFFHFTVLDMIQIDMNELYVFDCKKLLVGVIFPRV